MKVFYSISMVLFFSSILSFSSLVKAEEWEYPDIREEHFVGGSECPCFSIAEGLNWANTKIAGPTVDFHRPTSCFVDRPKITINFAYLNQERADASGPGFYRIVEGVVYNHVSATYDTVNERYECSSEDTIRTITAKEALMCHNLLKSTCQTMEDRICPCYSMSDLAMAEQRIQQGTTKIDTTKSCVTPTDQYDKYGLYEIGNYDTMGFPCDGCTTIMFAVQNSNSCFHGSDIVRTINPGQRIHCQNLMQKTCSYMDALLPSLDDPSPPLCHDDADFREEGIPERSCEWVSKDARKRCKKYDAKTGKRVFEYCRKTCGTCACVDDDSFQFKDDPNQNCAWVKDDPETRCALDESIKSNCIATCSSDCCKDNEDFEYMGYSMLNCEWVRAGNDPKTKVSKNIKGNRNRMIRNKNIRCRLKPFAANCPESCGMCPATDTSD